MALTTRYPGEIVIAESADNLIFGTVMLGSTYGRVESASVSKEADIEELKVAGNKLLAVIMSNVHMAFKFKALFDDEAAEPDLAELITFPFAGIQGRILPPITVEWEKSGHRMLNIEAKSWDAFNATNDGGANGYTFNGTVYTPIVDA